MSDGTRLVPGYHRLEVVYRGETSTIYRGLPDGGSDPVAIKVLRDPSGADEVDRLTTLSGAPGIVAALDHGQTTSGRTYVVMPFQDGDWAARLAHHHPIPVTEVVLAAQSVAIALTAMHGRDLLHHGVQPSNLLYGPNTTVLTDFGSVLPVTETPEPPSPDPYEVPHAPPEALRGDPPSPSSDVYRLASTVWTLLGGHLPYVDPGSTRVDPFDYRDRALTTPPPRIPRADLPQALRDVVVRAMSVNANDRFPTASDFAAALVTAHPAAAAFITPTPTSDDSASPAPDGGGSSPTQSPSEAGDMGEAEEPTPDVSQADSGAHAHTPGNPSQADAAPRLYGTESTGSTDGTEPASHTAPPTPDETADSGADPSSSGASGQQGARTTDEAHTTTSPEGARAESGSTAQPVEVGTDTGDGDSDPSLAKADDSPNPPSGDADDTDPNTPSDSPAAPATSADDAGDGDAGEAHDPTAPSPDGEGDSSGQGVSDAASGQAAIAGLVEQLRQATDAARPGAAGGSQPEDAWAALPGWSGSTATPSATPQQSPPGPVEAPVAHPHSEPPPDHQHGQQGQHAAAPAAPAPPPPPDYSGISAPPRQRPALIAVAVIAIGFLAVTAAAVAFLRPGLGGDLIASIRDSDETAGDAPAEEDQAAPLEEAPDSPPAPPAEQNPEVAPTDVEIVEDLGHEVVLSWTDNTSGAGSHHVVGGQSGAVPGNLVDTEPGETEVRVSGLNTEVDYCFTVIAVLSVDDVASAEQVCTTRETDGEGEHA